MVGGGGVRVDVNQELNFFLENSIKKLGGGEAGSMGGGSGLGGQDGCERRIEVLVKVKKKKFFFGGGVGGGGVGLGGQVGCERRIEVFCENSKKKNFFWGGRGGGGSGSGWGVRVDVNNELKFL